MANWCSNYITFEGSKKDLQTFFKVLNKSIDRMDTSDSHFKFILSNPDYPIQKYMFEIELTDEGCLSFQSKWSPDPVQIIQMVRPFNLSFNYTYEEMSMGIYGEFEYDYKKNNLADRYLNENELDKARYCSCDHKCNDLEDCTEQNEDWEQMDKILEKKKYKDVKFSLLKCEYYE